MAGAAVLTGPRSECWDQAMMFARRIVALRPGVP